MTGVVYKGKCLDSDEQVVLGLILNRGKEIIILNVIPNSLTN